MYSLISVHLHTKLKLLYIKVSPIFNSGNSLIWNEDMVTETGIPLSKVQYNIFSSYGLLAIIKYDKYFHAIMKKLMVIQETISFQRTI